MGQAYAGRRRRAKFGVEAMWAQGTMDVQLAVRLKGEQEASRCETEVRSSAGERVEVAVTQVWMGGSRGWGRTGPALKR